MTRVPTLSSPFLLGFDEIERALDRVVKGADGYPPYNIERLGRENGQPERLRITLAVAGFTRVQLDVTIEENQLVIRGKQQDDKTRQYIHRGIAARHFQRTFVLAEGMEAVDRSRKARTRADREDDRHQRTRVDDACVAILIRQDRTSGTLSGLDRLS